MTEELQNIEGAVCPLPLPHHDKILMGHGSGGLMTHSLIKRLFYPKFTNPILQVGDDAGVAPMELISPWGKVKLVVCTDSHVVSPLFFPGGDIGRLAICGTVNDLSMKGAVPLYLTAGFILEEGLDADTLDRITSSMQSAAMQANIDIIAGDTKVVQHGQADGLYINTSGIGYVLANLNVSGVNAQPGDIVIISGAIGDHGIAVLSARGELGFSADIQSDVAPLNQMIAEILAISHNIHVLRDPTRGGLATSLNEITQQSGVCIMIHDKKIPIHPPVAAACEMLGFDPLYIANEGKAIIIVSRTDAEIVLETLRNNPLGKEATIIGEVIEAPAGRVLMKTVIGGTRIVDMLAGEMLPRIC